ncbi:glycoside hydrolase superfamily [Aspergillus pseudoustus]|uniref:beta-glucosidase n=1 Tax=Aspergillus pseudoustus TaxID=1810923 RepID=A0ABR4JLE3_9EURO
MDIKSLVSRMTLEEKISLLSGADFWTTTPVQRLGIPALKVSDGPNGARGANFRGGMTSACFPASVSLAATFDRDLAARIGKALAEETLTKGANVLLGPTVCLHRDPRGGRNFESFSEDPYLAGELATQYILGLQREGIGATIKHYACNEQETRRFTIDARVSERALREIYLKPFEIAVKNAHPWVVMTSFNLVNGEHSDSNKQLLDILRSWGFDGLVMSDWGGVNSVAPSLNAGLDLEMPGPPNKYSPSMVLAALENGEVSENTLNARVEALLRLLERTGKFASPEIPEERAVDSPEHRTLIRQAGAEGIVLLKNKNGALPIQKDRVKSVALLGFSKEYLGHGGGSAQVNSHRRITPYEAFEAAVGDSIELRYAQGAKAMRNLPVLSSNLMDDEGNPGATLHVWRMSDIDEGGTKANVAEAFFVSNEKSDATAATMTATFIPTITGNHYLGFSTVGNTTIFINDEPVFRYEGNYPDVMAFLFGVATEEKKQYYFIAGQEYRIRIEAKSAQDTTSGLETYALNIVGFMLTFMTEREHDGDLLSEAVETAQSSDVAVVFVGNTPSWETEGVDRESMDLPRDGSLDRLIAATAAVNPNTIVVNSTGTPITMPWLESVSAVLQTWFPGQEAGHAIVDVLLGKVNPGGKLPVTFPKSIADALSYGNFPGNLDELKVEYAEDVFIGYRHFDRRPEGVQFPFGFGLSYTTFELHNATAVPDLMSDNHGSIDVAVDVTNTGSLAGSEVVQVYVGPATSSVLVNRPIKELAGFAKIWLEPHETRRVPILVTMDSAAYWSEALSAWAVDAGAYRIYVGTSSVDIKCTLDFEVAGGFSFLP